MIEPINAIERLLVEAAGDPQSREALLTALSSAVLYVSPLSTPDADGGIEGVHGVTLPSGEAIAALFTAPERVSQAIGAGAPLLAGKGKALLALLPPGPVALNPSLPPVLILTPAEIQSLADRSPPAAPDILLGRPAQTPVELVNLLNIELEALSEVAEAFLAVSYRAGETGSAWLLGVRSIGLWSAVQAAVDRAVHDFPFDRPLQLVDLDKSPLADPLRLEIAVIKTRKPSGFLNLMRR
jgi:hypothetical protein